MRNFALGALAVVGLAVAATVVVVLATRSDPSPSATASVAPVPVDPAPTALAPAAVAPVSPSVVAHPALPQVDPRAARRLVQAGPPPVTNALPRGGTKTIEDAASFRRDRTAALIASLGQRRRATALSAPLEAHP